MNGFSRDDLARHDTFVRKLATRLARNHHDADDLAQDVWVEALSRPPRSFDRFRGWLRTVALHGLANARRKMRSRERAEERALLPEAEPSALEELEHSSVRQEMRRLVDGLPSPYGEVVRLRYIEDLPLDRVAQQLGRRPGTVRVQLSRGLARLRREIEDQNGRSSLWSWAPLALLGRLQERIRPRAVNPFLGALGLPQVVLLLAGAVLVGTYLTGLARVRGGTVSSHGTLPGTVATPVATAAPGTEGALARGTSALATSPGRKEAATTGDLDLWAFRAGSSVPVSQLGIRLVRRSGGEARELLTDAGGRAFFEGLAAGTWLIQPQRGPAEEVTVHPGDAATKELQVPDGVSVRGGVVVPEKAPAGPLEIWVSYPGEPEHGRVLARADVDGRFEVDGVDTRSWIGARGEMLIPSKLMLLDSLLHGEGEPLEVYLKVHEPRGVLTIRMVDLDGRPVPGARVRNDMIGTALARMLLTGQITRQPSGISRTTDENGVARFPRTHYTANRLRIEAPGHPPFVTRGRGAISRTGSEANEEFVIVLPGTRTVRGRVRSMDGRPASGALVRYEAKEHGQLASATTDGRGGFVIDGVLPGAFELNAVAEGGRGTQACFHRGTFDDSELVIELDLNDRSTIHGTVRDGRGHELDGLTVVLEEASLAGARLEHVMAEARSVLTASTDEEGHFQLSGLPFDAYVLRVLDPAGLTVALIEEVRPGYRPLVIRVADHPGGAIEGRLVDPGDSVQLLLSSNALSASKFVPVDPSTGLFEVEHLPAADYVLRAHVAGYGVWEVARLRLETGDRESLGDLVPPVPGSVVIQLASPIGRKKLVAPEYQLLGSGTKRRPKWSRWRRGPSGWVLLVCFNRVPPGEHVFRFEAHGFAELLHPVVVGPGERVIGRDVLRTGTLVGFEIAAGRPPRPFSRFWRTRETPAGSLPIELLEPGMDLDLVHHFYLRLEPGRQLIALETDCGLRGEVEVLVGEEPTGELHRINLD